MRITVQKLLIACVMVMMLSVIGVVLYRTRAANSYATGDAATDMHRGSTIRAYGDTDGLLTPGGRVDLVLELHNHSDAAMTVTAISPAGGATVVDGGCSVDGALITALPQTKTIVLAPGEDTVVVPLGVYMDKSTREPCTGATFRVPVYVTLAGSRA